MRGKIVELNLFDPKKNKHGFIQGNDGKRYYFNQSSLLAKTSIDNFFEGDVVSFAVKNASSTYDCAVHVKLELHIEERGKTEYAPVGISSRLDMKRAAEDHLKPNSGELEVIYKLAQVLGITRIGHHIMDQASRYQFCLASVTDVFKQFVRESGEFLVIFSHFDNKRWQEKVLTVEREVRKRREIVERRPLVNFYILISNSVELREKVDSVKGKPQASVIPFSFEEILACKDKNELIDCMLGRFGEYYFENDMLGETDAIDDDNLLFGDRGKIADSVVARCYEGSNSGIFGLRRSGKSSVLHAVLRRLDWNNVPYVLVESRHYKPYSSWQSVLFDISCEIRARMLGTTQEENEIRDQYLKRLRLSSTEQDYEKRGAVCFIEDVNRYRGDNLFVIALDEIERITYNTTTSDYWKNLDVYENFWTALRDCGCPLVVCGVNSTINEVSTLTFNEQQCDNPMYGRISNCSESHKTYLPAFTDIQTRDMINTLGRYSNIAFSNVYATINRAFGGQPWAIRQFCSYAFKSVKDQRQNNRVFEISKATCDVLLRQYQSSSDGIHMCETILQHLGIYRSEYSLLKKIALNPEKNNTISSENAVSIDHLQKYGLIEYDMDTCYVSFCIGIIRDHICRTETKAPEDMTNTERRRYVQDRIAECERKLKRYVLNSYQYGSTPAVRNTLFFGTQGKCVLKPHYGVIPASCSFPDFFDHKKFDFYFSKLKTLISDNWNFLGSNFEEAKISQHKFNSCMDDLNAGRSDADHYDPENTIGYPDKWEIDDETMHAFKTAYDSMTKFFTYCGL